MADETITIETSGMHCQSCAMLIEMTVNELDGVQEAKVDLAANTTVVTFDPDQLAPDDIVAAIIKTGYGASVAS